MSGDQGWSGYYDANDSDGGEDPFAMGGFVPVGMGGYQLGMGGLDYNPSFAAVGSDSTYYPGDVTADADALNYLGYGAGYPSGGNGQKRDMEMAEGAWDTTFRAAVTAFQGNAGLKADGWIGPKTRQSLKAAVDRQNATPSSPGALPAPMPPPGVLPGFLPSPGAPSVPVRPASNVTPAAPAGGLLTQRNLLIAGGAVAVLGLGYFLTK